MPVLRLAQTAWLGVGFEGPMSAPHGNPLDAGTSKAVWLLGGVFLDDSFESGCLSHLHFALSPRAHFFFFSVPDSMCLRRLLVTTCFWLEIP